MVELIWANRKSTVLSASSLACLSHMPGVNLTLGCANNCIYCYARGYSSFPGENKVIVFKNTCEKLISELCNKRTKPQAVYFSPSSDIFQPVPEILELSHAILEILLSRDIGIAFVTKGQIPDKTMELLCNNAAKVRAQIGIIIHDDNVRSIFEPDAASIAVRLKQMAKMVGAGIAVEARIAPILSGITDTRDSIDCLYTAISSACVKRASISTLFLRPAITASLKTHMLDKVALEKLLGLYGKSRRLEVQAGHSSVLPLPKLKREEIYTRFIRRAEGYGIYVSICGCMNPDIGGTCNIAGKWPKSNLQRSLFQ